MDDAPRGVWDTVEARRIRTPLAFARHQELLQTGVQAVEGVCARVARESETPTADEGANRPAVRPNGRLFEVPTIQPA